MTGQAKPKYTRASGPKVRTGCITWIRHVKCDEAKPICNKCLVSQILCDGYLPVAVKQPARKTMRAARPQQRNDNAHSAPLAVHLHMCLNPDALHDDSATAFFYHFRTATIRDLALFHRSTKFWDQHVLPLGNAVPAVRHAATALGIAHRAFLGPSGPSAPRRMGPLDTLATQQYNKAIRQLLPHVSSGRLMDIRVIVTCSLLFYCLENIRGNASESVQHLRSGSRLIHYHPPHSATENIQSGLTGREDEAMMELSNLFARLGLETSLYSEDEVVPDLRSHMAPVSDIWSASSRPFPNVAAARDSLSDIDIDLGTYVGKGFKQAKKRQADPSVQEKSDVQSLTHGSDLDASTLVTADDLYYGPQFELEISSIHRRFRCWRRRFIKTVAEAKERGPTKQDRQEIMILTLRQRVWETGLDEVQAGDPGQADSILDQVELIVRSLSASHPRPIFTVESSVMSATSFVCFYSNEERHRRRALDLLRSARMREGVWDSVELADNIEARFPELKARGATPSTALSMTYREGECVSLRPQGC